MRRVNFITLTPGALTIFLLAAHGAPPSGPEMLRRQEHNVLVGRTLQKRCGTALAKRKAERMMKRAYSGMSQFKRDANDSLCILTPEVTQGPYHILGELVRQNITQGQRESHPDRNSNITKLWLLRGATSGA